MLARQLLHEQRAIQFQAQQGMPIQLDLDSPLLAYLRNNADMQDAKSRGLTDAQIVGLTQECQSSWQWRFFVSSGEKLQILEQQCYALCRIGDAKSLLQAKSVLENVTALVPAGSRRVALMRAKLLQVNGEWVEAMALLDSMLPLKGKKLDMDAKTDLGAMLPLIIKRKVAMFLDRKMDKEAVAELQSYLDVFPADVEAWCQLGRMFQRQQRYGESLFCWEECMMLRPISGDYACTYADTLMLISQDKTKQQQGTVANDYIKVASKYYMSVLELSPTHERALAGVESCRAKLATASDKQ